MGLLAITKRQLEVKEGTVGRLKRIVSLLFIIVIAACLVASFQINLQSTVAMLIFNTLFISLLFQLNGSLDRKLCLLGLGNITGFCWNFIFNSIGVEGAAYFGKIFVEVYAVFFPFLSSIWIISFWSLSLTALHHESTNRKMHL